MRVLLGATALAVAACGAGEVDPAPADASSALVDAGGGASADGARADALSAVADAGVIDPSGGSGGAYPGKQLRQAEYGGSSFDYYLYIPSGYSPTTPAPLLSLFHGQGGDGSNMVDFWQATAEANQLIVLATSSTGSSGGWVLSTDGNRWIAALDDALSAYNIDQARLYVWGFSAGGHLAHWLVLQGTNADDFAAYAVSAGVLDATSSAGAPASASRRIPVDIHIGASDSLLSAAQTDRQRFLSAGWVEGDSLSFVQFTGGHEVQSAQLAEIWAFLAPWTRP